MARFQALFTNLASGVAMMNNDGTYQTARTSR